MAHAGADVLLEEAVEVAGGGPRMLGDLVDIQGPLEVGIDKSARPLA